MVFMSVSALLHKVDFFIVETEVRGIPDEQLLLQFGFWPETPSAKSYPLSKRVLRVNLLFIN
jgi:hypothetical protein